MAVNKSYEEGVRRVSPIADRILVSDNLAPVVVGAGQEIRVEIDLRAMFDLVPDDYYCVRFSVEGYDPANVINFYQPLPGEDDTSSDESVTVSAASDSRTALALGSVVSVLGLTLFLLIHNHLAQPGVAGR